MWKRKIYRQIILVFMTTLVLTSTMSTLSHASPPSQTYVCPIFRGPTTVALPASILCLMGRASEAASVAALASKAINSNPPRPDAISSSNNFGENNISMPSGKLRGLISALQERPDARALLAELAVQDETIARPRNLGGLSIHQSSNKPSKLYTILAEHLQNQYILQIKANKSEDQLFVVEDENSTCLYSNSGHHDELPDKTIASPTDKPLITDWSLIQNKPYKIMLISSEDPKMIGKLFGEGQIPNVDTIEKTTKRAKSNPEISLVDNRKDFNDKLNEIRTNDQNAVLIFHNEKGSINFDKPLHITELDQPDIFCISCRTSDFIHDNPLKTIRNLDFEKTIEVVEDIVDACSTTEEFLEEFEKYLRELNLKELVIVVKYGGVIVVGAVGVGVAASELSE